MNSHVRFDPRRTIEFILYYEFILLNTMNSYYFEKDIAIF